MRNGTYEEEGWRLRKDGSRFWANVVITALIDADGRLQGFGKVTRDLTERKRTDERLRASEERFRLMVEGVTDYAIFMLDPSGNITTWNEGARRNKGYEANEIIGQHFSVFYMPGDLAHDKPAHELREAAAQGRFEDFGWRVRKDGSHFWANVVITAVKDKEGKLIGFSKVTRDLTERKRAEDIVRQAQESLEQRVRERTEELANAKAQAERAVQVRDRFLSIASHELKTPLTSLMLQIQMRQRRLAKPSGAEYFSIERVRKMVEDDAKQIGRLAHLVDDMLDISRLTAGKFLLNRRETDLRAIVREVLDRFANELDAANTPVSLQADAVVGEWDPYRLEQVVVNLVTNAMKYGAAKPVEIQLACDAGWATMIVRDQGIGIRAEDHQRIFEQFERAEASGTTAGLGLGLYIVQQIINTHGGTIHVESELNRGASFIVKLPVQVPAD